MLRAAAKNHARVTVLVDPADYRGVLDELGAGPVSDATRRRLAAKTYAHTAHYDAMVSTWLRRQQSDTAWPEVLTPPLRKKQDLRYGENPHQTAAFYADPLAGGASIATATQLQGKELSYNNIADADTALECVRQFDQTACVIVKHANPCGAALAAGTLEAYLRAYEPDPVSAFGGIIAFNRPLDAPTAAAIIERQFVEVIVAPAVSPEAAALLAAKQNIRVLQTGDLAGAMPAGFELRSVAGGLLAQTRDDGQVGPGELKCVTKRGPDAAELRDLLFAWQHLQVREVECHRVCAGRQDRGRRRRPDQPRGLDAHRRDQGRRRGTRGERLRDGLRRVLPVPRRPRRGGGTRRARRDPARRVAPRCGGHCRGRRARHRDGLHRHAALPALRRA